MTQQKPQLGRVHDLGGLWMTSTSSAHLSAVTTRPIIPLACRRMLNEKSQLDFGQLDKFPGEVDRVDPRADLLRGQVPKIEGPATRSFDTQLAIEPALLRKTREHLTRNPKNQQAYCPVPAPVEHVGLPDATDNSPLTTDKLS